MELERLEVVFDGDLSPFEQKLEAMQSKLDTILGRVKQTSTKSVDSVEKDFNSSQGFDKFTKQIEKMNANFEKQMNKMQQTSSKQGTAMGNNLASGVSKGAAKMSQDVQAQVDKINLKMQQAKAAQAKMANLQSDRNGASVSGNGKATTRIDDQMAKTQIQMNKAQTDAQAMVRKLKSEYDAIPSSLNTISGKMEANERQIEAMRSKVKALNAEMKSQQIETGSFSSGKWQSTGTEDTPKSTKTSEAIAKQSAKMEKLIMDNDALQQAYARTEDRASVLKTALGKVNTELGEQPVKSRMASNGMRNLANSTKQSQGLFSRLRDSMRSSLGNMGNLFNRQSKAVSSGTRGMNRSMGGFLGTVKLLWSQLFIFSFLYQGIMQLAGGLWSALKTNAQFSASLNQIKVNLLTAFYPIYQAVLPAINALMSGLAKATGYIASFISTLFGMNIGDAFSGAQGLMNGVQALNDTGTAADSAADGYDEMVASIKESNKQLKAQHDKTEAARKKAQEYKRLLAGFDELNILDFSEDSSDSEEFTPQEIPKRPDAGKTTSPWADFSNAKIPDTPKWLTDFAGKFKDIMSRLFDPIKQAWDAQGKKVIDAWKYALGEVIGLVQSIGRSFMEVWTNGTGQKFVENLLILLADVLNIIGDIAGAFKRAWDDEGRGTALIQSFFDMFNAILELLHQIAESFRNAWNDSVGESIAANLLEIFTNINNTIGNLATRFSEAWQAGGVGESIFRTILGIIDGLLGNINGMTAATAEWAKTLDFTPLLNSIDGLLKSIQPLTQNIGDGLEWFYTNVLLPLASFTIQDLIPAFLDALRGAINLLNGVIEALKPLFQWLWDSMLKPIAEWTGGVIVDVLKALGDALTNLGNWMKEHKEVIQGIATVLLSLAAAWGIVQGAIAIASVISTIIEVVTILGTLISKVGLIQTAVTLLAPVVGGLSAPILGVIAAIAALGAAFVLAYQNSEPFRNFINNLLEDIRIFAEKVYTEYIQPAIEEVTTAFQNAFEKIKGFWDQYGQQFMEACSNIIQFIWSIIGPFVQAFADTFKALFDNVAGIVRTAWDLIKGIFSGAFDIITGLIKVFTGIFTGDFKTALDGVKDIFSGAWGIITSGFEAFIEGFKGIAKTIGNVLIAPIEGAVNGIIGGVNWVLDAVNVDMRISKWDAPKFYAKVTNYHPGGPAVVNDASGSNYQEMFKLPDGRMGMFPKQRNMLIDLPRGSQVLPANMVPNYAGGVFDTFKDFFSNGFDKAKGIAEDVWNVISDPSKLVDMAMEQFVNLSGMLEPMWSIAKGALSTVKDSLINMVVDTINQFTGFSEGGLVDQFGFYKLAENDNPEMVVPLSKPQLAFQRINEALDFMGYDGIPDLTMPEVFRDSSDGYSGSSYSKGNTRTTSVTGTGLEGLNSNLIASLGETVASAIMAAFSNLNLKNDSNEPIEVILQVDSTRLGQVTIKGINQYHEQIGTIALNL
ncbi:hypothetical protein [Enterococcus sp. AZ103]|uniref:hypothetical protein n=1 Tax=Enterococcus sp. AZ103 TaxID=2774628 RepID=UPI003F285453